MAVVNRLFTQDISSIQIYANKPNYTDLTAGDLLRDFLGEFENFSITERLSTNPGRAIGEVSAYPMPYEVAWEIAISGRVDSVNAPLMALTIPNMSISPANFGALRSFWLWLWAAPPVANFYGQYSFIVRALMTNCVISGAGAEQTQSATFETQGDMSIAVLT